jgi:hypothetical protein
MIDREMLELAAKAAGIAIVRCRLDDPMWRDMLLLPKADGEGISWNPLTDDGDALRLAVKLGFVVNCWLDAKTTWAGCEADEDGCTELHGTDPLAATRRAIVCAAAAIGRCTHSQ